MLLRRNAGNACRAVPRRLLVLALLPLLGACETLGYYKQAIAGHMALLRQAQAVSGVIEQSGHGSELANKLRRVQQMRAFAEQALALPVGNAYSRYVDIDRDYVVWNVFAAPEFSTVPLRWCFPVAGCVGYRGYFSQRDARNKAASLASEGFDTHVAGATAYSTLGWTDDPLLSSFLRRNEVSLAALLFHELSHRLVYLKGDTAFNESFASAMEDFALQQWIAYRLRQLDRDTEHQDDLAPARAEQQVLLRQLQALRGQRALRREFVALAAQYREKLDALYARLQAGSISEDRARQGKQQTLDQLSAAVRKLAANTPHAAYYSAWASKLNNARLLPVALYSKWQAAFAFELRTTLRAAGCESWCPVAPGMSSLPEPVSTDRCQRALKSFYGSVRRLARSAKPARRELLERWDAASLQEAKPAVCAPASGTPGVAAPAF